MSPDTAVYMPRSEIRRIIAKNWMPPATVNLQQQKHDSRSTKYSQYILFKSVQFS